jgi:alkaline phosphatase
VENIDVNRFIARELGLNLEKTTDELFVSVRRELAGKAEFMVDRSLKATPVLHLSMNGKRVSFPANRNYFLNESKEKVPFDGVTVIQGDDAWIARDALKKIH